MIYIITISAFAILGTWCMYILAKTAEHFLLYEAITVTFWIIIFTLFAVERLNL